MTLEHTLNDHGEDCVRDPFDGDPTTGLIRVTGDWCALCHLPRIAYPGDGGAHVWCLEEAQEVVRRAA